MSAQKVVGAAAARRPGTVFGREGVVEAWLSGWPVLAALLPAAAAGTFHFGLPALSVMGGAAGGCLALRALSVAAVGRGRSLAPGRAALVGLLIGMSLPALSPAWLILAGCAVGMLFGTAVRGELGPGLHPATVALVFLTAVFPNAATAWTEPVGLFGPSSAPAARPPLIAIGADPAAALAGRVPGGSGSTSVLALALGGLFLLVRGAVRWQMPCWFLAGLAAPATAAAWAGAAVHAGPAAHLLSGDLALAAVFVAADPTCSPRTARGRLIHGAGCGLLTWSIRTAWERPEGVWFAVLLMNLCVPLIDRRTGAAVPRGRPLGGGGEGG